MVAGQPSPSCVSTSVFAESSRMSEVEENLCMFTGIVEEWGRLVVGVGRDGTADGCVRACVRASNLPPSAVRVEVVGASKAPGPPSLPWQCHVVSPHMLVCRGGGGVGWGWRGCGCWVGCVGGVGPSGSLRLFPVAVDTGLLCH